MTRRRSTRRRNTLANTQHPRIQILTVEELLDGKKLDMPAWRDLRTFKKAPKAKRKRGKEAELF
jgi:hypothetical protein